MPLNTCRQDNKPGFKWGDSGHCYTYTEGNESSRAEAKRKAMIQARAIEASRHGTSNQ